MLRIFFTVVYFLVFLFLIDLVFRNAVNPLTDLAALVCWVIAFQASVGLADYTVKKIRENQPRK